MSDSVTGSAAQRLLDFADKHAVDESNFDSNDRAVMHGMVLGIQREAEDRLIDRIVRLNYGKDPDLARRMDEARQRITDE